MPIKKIFLFILLLGILSGIVGYYYYEKNFYSKEILKLEILGPEKAHALEEVEYIVRYKNNGDVTLEEPELVFQYPENAVPLGEESRRAVRELEDIYPGEEKTISFKCRLLGKEGGVEKAFVSLRYKPKNLKAFYESETTLSTEIDFVPLTFEIDLPSKVEAGRDFDFYINYFSNSDWPLSDLTIKMDYPQDFEFISSQPKGIEKNEWNLSLLNKTEGGRIEIKGRLNGEIKKEEIFHASLGIWKEGKFILLKEALRGAEIVRASLSIFQQINGSSDYVASPGDLLHYEIFFRNIGEEPFHNLFLVADLEGKAFDFESLKTNLGEFNKNDGSIVWDWRKVPKLQFLGQGEEGKVEFWIALKDKWDIDSSQEKNAFLKNKVLISQTKEEFITKVNSKLEVAQKGYYNEEVFGNSGPLPPRAGEATTYTVIWQVKNYYNDLENVKIKGFLPQGVSLTGKIFPEDAKITFDSQSREIIWQVGDMEAGDGILKPAPNVAFQVSLTPSDSQKGDTALIIGAARATGEDKWTEKEIESICPEIDTSLPDDSTVTEEKGIVQ